MGLKDAATEAYKKEVDKIHKDDMEAAESFAVEAISILKGRIGSEFQINVISKEPCEVFLDVDGIKFKVDRHGVYVIKKCEMCLTEYTEFISPRSGPDGKQKTLFEVGSVLVRRHEDYCCKAAMERQAEKKEQTVNEKLLDALRCFMEENRNE